MKITKHRIKTLIADEKKSAKEYRRLGFPNIAKDEIKHRKILIKKLKRRIK